MTIAVTVKNEDSRETAVIGVQARYVSTDGFQTDGPETELKGGAEVTVYVHSGRELLIREISQ